MPTSLASSSLTVTRYVHPQITALDWWRSRTRGVAITLAYGRTRMPKVLSKWLTLLKDGKADLGNDMVQPQETAQFSQVYFTGGWVNYAPMREWTEWPVPVVFAAAGQYGSTGIGVLPAAVVDEVTRHCSGSAEPGLRGRCLLTSAATGGMICDLGQTHLKVRYGGVVRNFPRNFSVLPLAMYVYSAKAISEQRKAMRKFLSSKIRSVIDEVGSVPEEVIFAIPSKLDASGVPTGCSYAGMKDDTTLVADTLQSAGVRDAKVWLMNDAELAAMAALQDPQMAAVQKFLVVTLGFSLGVGFVDRTL